MQFILNKNIQNTKETLQVPSCADASALGETVHATKIAAAYYYSNRWRHNQQGMVDLWLRLPVLRINYLIVLKIEI